MFIFDFTELLDFGDKIVNTFPDVAEEIIQKVAKALYQRLKKWTPKETGELTTGWDKGSNLSFTVRSDPRGYFVELKNDVAYAEYVNYGHHSYNQYGGPYVVKNRHVVYYQGGNEVTFVYGHFFVERSILELEQTKAIKKIVERCLKTWYEGCTH